MGIGNRCVVAAVVLASFGAVMLSAQDAVSEVRKAMEGGRPAAAAKDANAHECFPADDLRWVTSDGRVNTKQHRVQAVTTEAEPPTYGETMDIKVFAETIVRINSGGGQQKVRYQTWGG